MHYFTYDYNERLKRQNPEQILSLIGVKSGMTFADIGCNDGFFTIPAAKIVGPKGKVFGVDIDQSALTRLREKIQSEKLGNVKAVSDEAEHTIFCNSCIDIIFYGTVLHDFREPLPVLKNAFRMLKAGGKLVDYDWRKTRTDIGPPLFKRLSHVQASDMIKSAGFDIREDKIVSGYFYQLTAVKP